MNDTAELQTKLLAIPPRGTRGFFIRSALRARLGLSLFLALVFLQVLLGVCLAQQAPADIAPEKAQQFLGLLSDPEVKAWLERKIPAATEEPSVSIMEETSRWEAAARNRIGALLGAFPRIPEELANATAIVSRDVNSGRPGLVGGILAILIASSRKPNGRFDRQKD